MAKSDDRDVSIDEGDISSHDPVRGGCAGWSIPRQAGAHSNLKGTFRLTDAIISFSQLQFQVPGTRVNLTGTYSLDGNQFDFHGKARMDAKLSHMVTGWKAILLKPADPFFSKNGAGTEIPVKVTGTKSEPHFGADFGHRNEDKNTADRGPKY